MQTHFTYSTAKEILASYPLSRTTLYRLIQKGDLPPPVKFGSRSYWKSDEFDEAVKAIEEKRFQ